MNFVSGFLALCSAVGVGTATEIVASDYERQSISFTMPKSGVSESAVGYDFGLVGVAPIVGRAIYDAPTGGNLLFVLPHATPRLPSGGSSDRGGPGYITLILTALEAYPDGSAYSGSFAAASTLGLCFDADELIGWTSTAPNVAAGVTALARGGQFLSVNASSLSNGVALTALRGLVSG